MANLRYVYFKTIFKIEGGKNSLQGSVGGCGNLPRSYMESAPGQFPHASSLYLQRECLS